MILRLIEQTALLEIRDDRAVRFSSPEPWSAPRPASRAGGVDHLCDRQVLRLGDLHILLAVRSKVNAGRGRHGHHVSGPVSTMTVLPGIHVTERGRW